MPATLPTPACFSALEGHELSQMFIDQYSGAFVTGIADYFERRIAEGAFRPVDPLIAAQTFVGTAAHFGLNQAIFHRCAVNLPQDRIVEGFIDIFLEGIKKRS